MMANDKENMMTARDLIKRKQYTEARAILTTINHPTAQEWIGRIDSISPKQSEQPAKDPYWEKLEKSEAKTETPARNPFLVWMMALIGGLVAIGVVAALLILADQIFNVNEFLLTSRERYSRIGSMAIGMVAGVVLSFIVRFASGAANIFIGLFNIPLSLITLVIAHYGIFYLDFENRAGLSPLAPTITAAYSQYLGNIEGQAVFVYGTIAVFAAFMAAAVGSQTEEQLRRNAERASRRRK